MRNFFFLLIVVLLSCQSRWQLNTTFQVDSGPCLGLCPDYNISIQADQNYRLTDRHSHQTYIGRLTDREFQTLQQIVTKKDFFQMDSLYGSPVMYDMPLLRVSFGNQKTIIRGRHAVPDLIQPLIEITDQIYAHHQEEY